MANQNNCRRRRLTKMFRPFADFFCVCFLLFVLPLFSCCLPAFPRRARHRCLGAGQSRDADTPPVSRQPRSAYIKGRAASSSHSLLGEAPCERAAPTSGEIPRYYRQRWSSHDQYTQTVAAATAAAAAVRSNDHPSPSEPCFGYRNPRTWSSC